MSPGPVPSRLRNLEALERELFHARRLLGRLEAIVADDLRLGFTARHTRALVTAYRASLRMILDRRDELRSTLDHRRESEVRDF